jgi:hypothetical protein
VKLVRVSTPFVCHSVWSFLVVIENGPLLIDDRLCCCDGSKLALLLRWYVWIFPIMAMAHSYILEYY